MPYLLDTSVFIEAKNDFYGMDFCPAFWYWLVKSNRARKLFSIDKVRDELKRGEDQLSDWAKDRGGGFFIPSEGDVLFEIESIKRCMDSNNYNEISKRNFMSGADCFLVAHAKVRRFSVVTRERYEKNTNKVKIPNICEKMGIRCVPIATMLRNEKAQFVLGKAN